MPKTKIESEYLHLHFIDRVAFFNGLISGLALLPQALKVLMNRSVADVSFISVVLIFLNSIVWLLYAFHRSLVSVAISALLNILSTIILGIAYLIF